MVYAILLLVVAALIGGGVCSARHAQRQRRQAEHAELHTQLHASLRAADDDVAQFGEDLQRLEADVGARALDELVQQDYADALRLHDDARLSLTGIDRPEEIRHVTELLGDGRYAISSVKARLAEQLPPRRLPPCFFNPAHGPSSASVLWAPTGGNRREVPACPADIARVEAGADPYIRTVQHEGERVPYWEGGQAYAPWAQGYYHCWRDSNLVSGALIGSFLFGGGDDLFTSGWFTGVGDGVDEVSE